MVSIASSAGRGASAGAVAGPAAVAGWIAALCLLLAVRGCWGTRGAAGGAPATPASPAAMAVAGDLAPADVAARDVAAREDHAGPADRDAGRQAPVPPVARDRAFTQVMITLAPAPPPIWEQITRDLERTYRLRTLFSWSMQSLGERCIVFEAPGDRPIEALVRRLASDPRVELAQPVQRFVTQGAHTPSLQVPLQHSAQVLHLAQAHRWATGKGVRIAVIDTGVDVEHPELRGQIVKIGNFVELGGRADPSFNSDIHGTAVAGVIAAALNSDLGLVGVAPQAQVFALKACWQERPGAREAVCDSYTLSKAIDFAITQGAQVLNFSLAGPPDPMIAKLVVAALARGIVVVAADGPDPARSFPGHPARGAGRGRQRRPARQAALPGAAAGRGHPGGARRRHPDHRAARTLRLLLRLLVRRRAGLGSRRPAARA